MAQTEDLKDTQGAAEAMAAGRGAGAKAPVPTSKGRREGGHGGVPGRSGMEGVMPGAKGHVTEHTHAGSSQGCNGQKS